MILWKSMVRLSNHTDLQINQIDVGQEVLSYSLSENGYSNNIVIQNKKNKRNPYRLRTKSAFIDLFLTNSLLIRKKDNLTCFRRVCDITKEHEMVLVNHNGIFRYEPIQTFIGDPAKMVMYSMVLAYEPKAYIVNGFVVKAL